MSKKIKITLESHGGNFYRITKLVNAAMVTDRRGSGLILGSDVMPEAVDDFARDRRWDVTIIPAQRG